MHLLGAYLLLLILQNLNLCETQMSFIYTEKLEAANIFAFF